MVCALFGFALLRCARHDSAQDRATGTTASSDVGAPCSLAGCTVAALEGGECRCAVCSTTICDAREVPYKGAIEVPCAQMVGSDATVTADGELLFEPAGDAGSEWNGAVHLEDRGVQLVDALFAVEGWRHHYIDGVPAKSGEQRVAAFRNDGLFRWTSPADAGWKNREHAARVATMSVRKFSLTIAARGYDWTPPACP
jgi:hypothetical protein